MLQWRKRAVGQGALNTFIRLLLHGLALRASDGTAIQLTSHILRHVFATELATLNVPVDSRTFWINVTWRLKEPARSISDCFHHCK